MKSDPKSWPLILITLALLATIAISWIDRHYFPEKKALIWLCFDIDGEHAALAIERAARARSTSETSRPINSMSTFAARQRLMSGFIRSNDAVSFGT